MTAATASANGQSLARVLGRDARWSVTGGAGFLGKPTVRLLESFGAEVRVVRSAEHDLRDPAACRGGARRRSRS